MALKTISTDLQLFSAASSIIDYKKAIEQLVYNSLDAKSTSIAIRIDFTQNSFQVVDNGKGIKQADFKLIGQRFTTSKFIDLSTLKSVPGRYGFKGQALASIIQISKNVKLISRCENNEDTCMKEFYKGKSRPPMKTRLRPSKGTTIEIKGFLYNLKIRKEVIDVFNEMQSIKALLQQLSLIHNNVSMSLRDDTKDEIVFKIHKNRDIYQTLAYLFNVQRDSLQELQVEKNQYKIKAYISKIDADLKHYQWIYLNGKFIHDSILHKKVNDIINTSLNLKDNNKKLKTKKALERESNLLKYKIPFYFIFLSCPFNDYDISYTPRNTFLEFKNWDPIEKLIEKLVMFYKGEINLKNITKVDKIVENEKKLENSDTKNKVKKIMAKILGNHSRNIKITELQNGIKGKLIKKRIKVQTSRKNKSSVDLANNRDKGINVTKNKLDPSTYTPKNIFITPQPQCDAIKLYDTNKYDTQIKRKQVQSKSKLQEFITNKQAKLDRSNNDRLIKQFEKNIDTVKRRCKVLNEKVNDVLNRNEDNHEISYNESKVYTVSHDNKCMSYMSKVTIHNKIYKPILPQRNHDNNKVHIGKSVYDLLQTVIKTQENSGWTQANQNYTQNEDERNINLTSSNQYNLFTYNSHNYTKSEYTSKNVKRNLKFISSASRNNFNLQKGKQDNIKLSYSKTFKPKRKRNGHNIMTNKKKTLLNDLIKRIQVSSNNTYDFSQFLFSLKHNTTDLENTNIKAHSNPTYTVEPENIIYDNFNINTTYSIGVSTNISYLTQPFEESVYTEKNDSLDLKTNKKYSNIIFISESQHNGGLSPSMDPMIFCETHYDNHDPYKNECRYSFINNNDLVSGNAKYYNKPNENINNIQMLNCTFLKNSDEKLQSSDAQIIKHSSILQDVVVSQDTHNSAVNNKCSNYLNNMNKQREVSDYYPAMLKIMLKEKSKSKENNGINNDFYLRSRYCFIPKGMSPILENVNSIYQKSCQSYDLNKKYYEHGLYHDFAKEVLINSEIFEPSIQNVKDIVSKDMDRVNVKIKKNDADLLFNGKSLLKAKVLGQVDKKFIVGTLHEKSGQMVEEAEFLVLFDQHGVDERISLEDNIRGYLNNAQWNSIALDPLNLKLSENDILYLNNHKDKFSQYGLQWTITNAGEISVTAIPGAILGKNLRQFDEIIKAVRNLISELINSLKSIRGNTPLYPKTIMELVFSESCRHAIKFGDKLTKNECAQLIKNLANCKTPFQCAHGRPVMAVLTAVKHCNREYKVNWIKVFQLKKKY